MLHFDAARGLYADEIETVREAVRAQWRTAFAREGRPPLIVEPETPAGQLIDSQTAAIVEKDNEVLFLAQQFNPFTAEGVWQDALAKIYFLTRKTAQPGEAVCVCTGLQGTVIAQGAVVKKVSDNTEWVCAQTVTIPASGTVLARFRSRDSGAVTADAHTLTQIVTVTPGWDSVDNPTAATPGIEAETQAEFEARRFASVAANAHGSVAALYGAIHNLDGVIDCVVLENTTNVPIVEWGVTIPGHSVWIAVVGGDDAAIAEMIYRKKDAGCGTAGNTAVTYQDLSLPWRPIYAYQIERPAPLAFRVRVTLERTPGLAANAAELVRQAVLGTFNGTNNAKIPRVGMAQTLYASRFYCPIMATGIESLVSIELSADGGAWVDSVTINADRTPVLNISDVIVVITE